MTLRQAFGEMATKGVSGGVQRGDAAASEVGGRGKANSAKSKSAKPVLFSKRTDQAKWLQHPKNTQFFGVARHCERADAAGATLNGQAWYQSQDFGRCPHDPPLSDNGLLGAAELADVITRFTAENRVSIDVIVSSPYFSCVQTASEVCRSIGPTVRLLLDAEFGEVFGPEVFGNIAPHQHLRDKEEVRAYCRALGVRMLPYDVGAAPRWPESLQASRRRFAHRYLAYLHRSRVTRKNFLVITHADCVAAALSMMPSFDRVSIERVPNGGMFLARRSLDNEDMGISPGATLTEPREEARAGEEKDKGERRAPESLGPTRSAARSSTLDSMGPPVTRVNSSTSISSVNTVGIATMASELKAKSPAKDPMKAVQGWSVCMTNVDTKERKDCGSTYIRRMQPQAAHSDFSQGRMDDLLGGLSPTPFRNDDVRMKWVNNANGMNSLAVRDRQLYSPNAIPEDALPPAEGAISAWVDRGSRPKRGDSQATSRRAPSPQRVAKGLSDFGLRMLTNGHDLDKDSTTSSQSGRAHPTSASSRTTHMVARQVSGSSHASSSSPSASSATSARSSRSRLQDARMLFKSPGSPLLQRKAKQKTPPSCGTPLGSQDSHETPEEMDALSTCRS